jgi:thiosulfate/3-mercaptopyruvate sulfurtransferase
MYWLTLITPSDLSSHLDDPDWAVVDCRFSLADPSAGRRAYEQNHIPGAVYAHLDDDLSGTIVPGETGRHPLPSVQRFSETLSRWGVDEAVQVVAYDDVGGALAASRLWWMLRWLGHEHVAVMDGGWPRWERNGFSMQDGTEFRTARRFTPHVRANLLAETRDVAIIRADASWRLIDARGADRFRGENETIDPVAGHIPGAISLPHTEDLGADGSFLPADELRAIFAERLDDVTADRVAVYCGSGVTAAQHVLAMAHCGLGNARLYVGSWSEWITDPERPVAERGPAEPDGTPS